MDVKTVCLGMLTEGEASGYDLKKNFESTFGHFFAAGYGSIYPALASLANQGLVDCECIPQEGKPDRKVYRITDAGHDYLLEALDNPNPSHKVRSEFLATLCFSNLLSDEQIETMLANRIDEIDMYEKIFDEIESECLQDWPAGMQFVVGFGRAMTEAKRKYIEDNRHMLVTNKERRRATG